MTVYKSIITITVLSEDRGLAYQDIERILEETDSGASIGWVQLTSANVEVPADKLKDELLAISNDGTFFDVEHDECDVCGEPAFIQSDGISHHGSKGEIDHDADADHVALAMGKRGL